MEKDNDGVRRQIADMYLRNRLPGLEIAAALGLPASAVFGVLRKDDIVRRPRGRNPEIERPDKDILQEMQLTMTEVEIADELGVSKRTVQRWKRDLGLVSVRKPGRRPKSSKIVW